MIAFSSKNLCHSIVVYHFLLFIIKIAEVEATGTLELTMNYFQNPSEHLDDGTCCDAFCIGQCDDIFQFSLDQSSGRVGDARSYYYWTKKTGTFQDQDNVYFQDNMKGVNNPILWNFDSWPGSVLFKVYIEDDDYPYSANDYLDAMVQSLTLIPAKTKSQATETTITIYGIRARDKTVLSLSYKIYCDDNYYGPSCSVNCVPQDSDTTGHYTCDPDTGKKLCRTGWEDESKNCLTFADDCVGKDCHNGRCVDGIRSYTCSCIEGFTGAICDTNIDECASSPCRNEGTCSDLIDGYTCACAYGFVGPQCQYAACSQPSTSPCNNGGACYGNSQCLCQPGYVGNKCELRTCDVLPCVNGGNCTSNGTCLCPSGYIGNQCEVRKCEVCDHIPDNCKNYEVYVDGKCDCQEPYYGINCEQENCTNSTCQNGGACITMGEGMGYKCACTQSYGGQNCQSPSNQPTKRDDADVSAFDGDIGTLLIILIVLCVLLFITVVVLIVVMCSICYRRRKKRVYAKRRADSTLSTSTIVSSVSDSVTSAYHRYENKYSNSSLDDVFGGGSATPPDTLWKKGFNDDNSKVSGCPDNHYEKLDEMMEQSEVTVGQGSSEPPERFTCKISDIHGQSVGLENKLAK